MATLTSDLAAEQVTASTNGAASVRDGARISGDLLIARASYTITTSEAADDILRIVKLPDNAVIHGKLSYARCANPGTALVAEFGTEDDTDAIASAITMSAGGQFDLGSNAAPLELTADTWIAAKLNTVTSLTADVVIYFEIVYSLRS